MNCFLEQVEVCADLHLRPPTTVTKTTQTASITGSEAWNHCVPRLCHTLYARVKNKRYTLAVRRLKDGDTASSVPLSSFEVLDGLDAGVKAVYLDRGFYDSKCLTLLQAHNYAYVIPIIRWGEAIQQELSEGWSRVIQHDLTGKPTVTAGPSIFPSTSTVRTPMGSMTRTVWRVTATPLTRRSSTHHGTLDTTTRNASVSSQAIACLSKR